MEFEAWPKIPRLRRDITITEKIDGTNAAVLIEEMEAPWYYQEGVQHPVMLADGRCFTLQCQSRTRLVTPADDNFGFAMWAYTHAEELVTFLGEGRHFGEWWGSGIQRRYGLDHKRFSLFNVNRWGSVPDEHWPIDLLDRVPVLYRGPFSSTQVDHELDMLRLHGSSAAPGFMDPEGIVVFLNQARLMFKATCKNDEQPKGQP